MRPNFHGRSFRPSRVLILAVSCLVLGSAACQSDPNPVRQRVALQVGAAQFQVEIAATPEQRETGLMFRTVMADDQGMLFIFEQDAHQNFWMKNTILPLSIAYISADGTIREILDMVPESLSSVPSTWAVRYALELNLGAFARAGVKVGDRMVLPQQTGP